MVPVMLTFNDTDRKTVKERSRSRVCINSKEHENVISFRMHIITFLGFQTLNSIYSDYKSITERVKII